jgi:hypothetical protein
LTDTFIREKRNPANNIFWILFLLKAYLNFGKAKVLIEKTPVFLSKNCINKQVQKSKIQRKRVQVKY